VSRVKNKNKPKATGGDLDPLKLLNSIKNLVEGVLLCDSEGEVFNEDLDWLRKEFGDPVAATVAEFCASSYTKFVKYALLYDQNKKQFIILVGRDAGGKHIVQAITLEPREFVVYVDRYCR
jgi:hypothetical protein